MLEFWFLPTPRPVALGGRPRKLCFLGARPTGLDFAVLAFEDVPEGAGVAEVAVPKQKVGF